MAVMTTIDLSLFIYSGLPGQHLLQHIEQLAAPVTSQITNVLKSSPGSSSAIPSAAGARRGSPFGCSMLTGKCTT